MDAAAGTAGGGLTLMELLYQTRDGKGNDIEKLVQIKDFQTEDAPIFCPCCHKQSDKSVPVKKLVSGNFTDWSLVGERVCPNCAALFSLYFYNYVVGPDGIRLLNVRQLRDELVHRSRPSCSSSPRPRRSTCSTVPRGTMARAGSRSTWRRRPSTQRRSGCAPCSTSWNPC